MRAQMAYKPIMHDPCPNLTEKDFSTYLRELLCPGPDHLSVPGWPFRQFDYSFFRCDPQLVQAETTLQARRVQAFDPTGKALSRCHFRLGGMSLHLRIEKHLARPTSARFL